MRAKRGVIRFLLASALLMLVGLGVLWFHDPFPVNTGAPHDSEILAAWWAQPNALSADEVAAQQWLADITCRLPPAREQEVWQVGGSQHGVFSIRYQAAFAGYAAAALGMRTPAYVGLTQSILSNTVSRLVDRKAWAYIQSYWSQEPWFPDPCAKGNVMYTGHLMQLMALEEALSGDPRYSHAGVELVWDAAHSFRYTTQQLADVTAAQMRAGDGGVPCEPGLVFFACNNHPQIAFRLLEGMGYGDWRSESAKWERWALRRFQATAGGGAFRILHHEKTGLAYPRGMPGFDGWSLLWYAPWASDRANLPILWRLAREKIVWSEYGDDPGEQPGVLIKASCCNPVQVPAAATASFLAAASRACNDTETAIRLEAWLDRHFRKTSEGRLWLNTNREWRTGVTANRILALAQANGSDLRAMVRRPLPRAYFNGLLLASIEPSDTPVFQAYRDPEDALVIELGGRGEAVALVIRNAHATAIAEWPNTVAGKWNPHTGTLLLAPCGRTTLKIRNPHE